MFLTGRIAWGLVLGHPRGVSRRGWLLLAVAVIGGWVSAATAGVVHVLDSEGARFDERSMVEAVDGEAVWQVEPRHDSWRGVQYPVVWLDPLDDKAQERLPLGMPAMPPPGGWYLSPGLQSLAAANPTLSARFPGARTLEEAGVLNPDELLAYRRLPEGGHMGYAQFGVEAFGSSGSRLIGDPIDLEIAPVLLATTGFVALPLLILTATALGASATTRHERLLALRAIGIPQRTRSGLVAAETLFAVLPGAVLGAMLWLVTRAGADTLPLIDRAATPGEQSPVVPAFAAALVYVVAAVVVGVGMDLLRRGRPRSMRRAVFGQALSPIRWVPLAGGLALLVLGAVRDGRAASLSTLGGVLLIAAGLPLVLPVAVRTLGRALADGAVRPARLLAGRKLQLDPVGAARPLYGIAAVLVVLPVVATWIATARHPDPPAPVDSGLSAVRLVGPLDDDLVSAVVAARPVAVSLPVLDGEPVEGGPQLTVGATCAQVAELLDATVCERGELTGPAVARLQHLLALPDFVRLSLGAVDLASASSVTVAGPDDGTFEEDIRAAALNQNAVVSVLSSADLRQRESVLVSWIVGGMTLLAFLVFAALAVGMLDTALNRASDAGLLTKLGVGRAVAARFFAREFAWTYVTVTGVAAVAGGACSIAWHNRDPGVPYPTAVVVALYLSNLALAAVGMLGVWAASRGRDLG